MSSPFNPCPLGKFSRPFVPANCGASRSCLFALLSSHFWAMFGAKDTRRRRPARWRASLVGLLRLVLFACVRCGYGSGLVVMFDRPRSTSSQGNRGPRVACSASPVFQGSADQAHALVGWGSSHVASPLAIPSRSLGHPGPGDPEMFDTPFRVPWRCWPLQPVSVHFPPSAVGPLRRACFAPTWGLSGRTANNLHLHRRIRELNVATT
jgi:hypothetical protein